MLTWTPTMLSKS